MKVERDRGFLNVTTPNGDKWQYSFIKPLTLTIQNKEKKILYSEDFNIQKDKGEYTHIATQLGYSPDDVKQILLEINKHVGDEFNEAIREYTDFVNLAEKFLKKQPLYYDTTKKWWIWKHSEYKWVMVDETDIMNRIDDALEHAEFTIRRNKQNEILEALRRAGRRNTPKQPKNEWVQFHDEIHDVKTGETHPATSEYFITNPIPWRVGMSANTPTIDRLLHEWVVKEGAQNDTWVQTLYEILAYSMLQYQPLQRIFALTGAGANGKTTYLGLLTKFVGFDNIATTELRRLTGNDSRFETSALHKKLVVLMSEAQDRDLKNTDLIKRITGEEPVRFEFKGKGAFSDYSYATCILATNSLPITPDQSLAFYRRFLIVDFPNRFEIKHDVISSIPEHEYENLAFKLLTTARELLTNNKFTNEGSMNERMVRYETRSNPVGAFIQTECQEDIDGHIIFRDFFNKLQEYLTRNNHKRMTGNSIGRLLRTLGYSITKRSVKLHDESHATKSVIEGINWKEGLSKHDEDAFKKYKEVVVQK